MNHRASRIPLALGVALLLVGGLLVVHWAVSVPLLRGTQASQLGLNPALLFAVAGLSIVALSRPALGAGHRAAGLGGWALIVYPALILSQGLFGVHLGLDFPNRHEVLGAVGPHPGRLSANGALAFIGAGVALVCLSRPPTRPCRVALVLASGSLWVISLAGVLGYALGLQQLYSSTAAFNRMLLPTALGLVTIAWAITELRRAPALSGPADARELARRIGWRTVATLSLVALIGGVAGFAMLRQVFEEFVTADARESAQTSSLALTGDLQAALELPARVVARPGLVAALHAGARDTHDARALRELKRLAESLLSDDLIGLRILSAEGRLLAHAGQPGASRHSPVAHAVSAGTGDAELRWNDGYVLHTETAVTDQGALIGRVVAEQRLAVFDQVMRSLRRPAHGATAYVCGREAQAAVCSPIEPGRARMAMPMFDDAGGPAFAVSRALLGETGVQMGPDARGEAVVDGFAPVGRYGLGLVVQTDVSSLYAPLRQRLLVYLGLVVALVGGGGLALQARVRPLFQAALAEQRRSRAILATSTDAFIAADTKGRVTDWNIEATRLLGWREDEARGRRLSELIVPPPYRQAHDEGYARFSRTGEGVVVNRRTELVALHREGGEIPVEISVTALDTGDGYESHAFLHDIRRRKEAQRQLEASERQLHEVLGEIPAMVGSFDRDERCLFANELARRRSGLSLEQARGRRLAEGLSAEAYRQHQPHIARALAGEQVRFEGVEIIEGRPYHYEAHVVPKHGVGDAVVGFHLMTFDVTRLHRTREEAARSAARLRAITDNVPAMIFYVDRHERVDFANNLYRKTFGDLIGAGGPPGIAGLPGADADAEAAAYRARALGGEHVTFESEHMVDGQTRHFHQHYVPEIDAHGRVLGFYGLVFDITAAKQLERKLEQLAMVDPLTGLPNRRAFEERIEQAMARCRRSKRPMGLAFLDVDHFKQINDQHGHAGGDAVLQQFARRLQASIRVTDFACRLAGDEFVVILEGLNSSDEVSLVAAKIVGAIQQEMRVGGQPLVVTTSVGVAYYEGLGATPQALMQTADHALYRAKARGRNTFAVASHEAS